MKTRFLLTAISIITLLSFSSCEKDEMGVGGTSTSGGGKEDSVTSTSTTTASNAIRKSFETDTLIHHPFLSIE